MRATVGGRVCFGVDSIGARLKECDKAGKALQGDGPQGTLWFMVVAVVPVSWTRELGLSGGVGWFAFLGGASEEETGIETT